jgi:hypothetical protein
MTRPAQAIAAASAVMADQYATATSVAAREATRAAEMACHHGRTQNVTSTFVRRAAKAARTGDAYEQTLQAADTYGQMAGIASTAKYAAATANAARYAADAAEKQARDGPQGALRTLPGSRLAGLIWRGIARSIPTTRSLPR